jgi:beta-lactamase superfamily II metal-dependent hydrolase
MRGGLVMRFNAGLRLLGLIGLASLILLHGCAEKDTSIFEPDVTPPFVSSAGETDGRITWTTNEACFCVLLYGSREGTYDHYGYHVADGGRSHYVDLIDVEPGQYYMRIIATDHAGNTSTGDEMIFTVTAAPETENLAYTMVDVGWGDCHFLEFPNGTNIMIDSGYGELGEFPHSSDLFSFLNARGIPSPSGIDYMISTHNHADHFGGFLDLIPLYSNTMFLGPARASSSVFDSMKDRLNDFSVPWDSLSEGQTNEDTDILKWDEEHGIGVKVLSAGAARIIGDGNGNNDAIVFKITYGEVDFLLNGDAEDVIEQRMLKAYGGELDCEVLKVGHHANDDATSEEFLAVATPRVGCIPNSMEENDGVFDQAVINLLLEYGVDYYVSDRAYRNAGRYDEPEHGHVTVTTDGETFVVWAWK